MGYRKITDAEIAKLDPYSLMAAVGKKVIHPGAGKSTEELYELANIQPGMKVLDIGCGVGATAIEMAQRFKCTVVAADYDELMVIESERNVRKARVTNSVSVVKADILKMPFRDNEFDIVVIEAVTMLVDRDQAVKEIYRVCKPGGLIVEHEFIWREKPTREMRAIFEVDFCPGIVFDNEADWIQLFKTHGFQIEKSLTGDFVLVNFGQIIKDEGVFGTLRMIARTLSRRAYIKRVSWFLKRIVKVRSSLGYILLSAVKPA